MISGLSIVVHHVRIVTKLNRPISNSPEGIHQDGFPFIVSAFVVEREKVSGGISTIFGPDKKTEIFTTTLLPGVGLLQADQGSDLWHRVSPIYVDTEKFRDVKSGYRSSIGFDIKPLLT